MINNKLDIEAILDIKIELILLNKKGSLPLFLSTGYKLYTCNLFSQTFLIAQAPINNDTTPAQFKKIKIVENVWEAQAQLEILSYNPKILIKQNVVDDLSMFLSLREDTDERVQIAFSELLEKFKWRR